MTIASVTRSPGGSRSQQPTPSESASISHAGTSTSTSGDATTTDTPGPRDIRGIRKAGKVAAHHRSTTRLGPAPDRAMSERPSMTDAIRERARASAATAAPAARTSGFGIDLGDIVDDVVDTVEDAVDEILDSTELPPHGIRKPGRQAVRAHGAPSQESGPALTPAIDRGDYTPSRTPVSVLYDPDQTAVRKPGFGEEQPAGAAGAVAGAAAARTASFGFDLPDLPDVVDDIVDVLEEVIEDGGGGGGIRKPG